MQVAGATVAALVLYQIANGRPGFDGGLAANGYAASSPGGYSMGAGLIAEVVLTMMFLFIILGATDDRAPAGFAPIAIGLGLTLIHLVGIPVTNLSVNPARSTGPAVVVGGVALAQLWLFWVAPIVGAAIGAVIYRWLCGPSGRDYAGHGLQITRIEIIRGYAMIRRALPHEEGTILRRASRSVSRLNCHPRCSTGRRTCQHRHQTAVRHFVSYRDTPE